MLEILVKLQQDQFGHLDCGIDLLLDIFVNFKRILASEERFFNNLRILLQSSIHNSVALLLFFVQDPTQLLEMLSDQLMIETDML